MWRHLPRRVASLRHLACCRYASVPYQGVLQVCVSPLPRRAAGMRQGEVPSSQGVQTPQDRQTAGNGVSSLHAQETRHPTAAVDVHYLCRYRQDQVRERQSEREGARTPSLGDAEPGTKACVNHPWGQLPQNTLFGVFSGEDPLRSEIGYRSS